MSEKLPKDEQATVIEFSRTERKAHVFTSDESWQRYIEKDLGIRSTYSDGSGGKLYDVPKKMIRRS